MAVVAALAAVITWALLVFAVDTGAEQTAPATATSADVLSSLNANEREYVEGGPDRAEARLAPF